MLRRLRFDVRVQGLAARAWIVALVLGAHACSGPVVATDVLLDVDAAATLDGPPPLPSCTAMGIECSGERALRCAAVGAQPVTFTCSGATPVCTRGVGCTVCRGGARQCNATDPTIVEQCAADGSSAQQVATCTDPAQPVCVDGRCTDPCAEARSTPGSLGCEFWAVTTANYVSNAFTFAVSISNPQRYPVRVRIEGGALTGRMERTIAPGAVEAIPLPWVPSLSFNMQTSIAGSARVSNGAYRISTTAPVAAYQFNPLEYQRDSMLSQSNDASLLLPTSALSGRYVITTFQSNRPSPFFAIVGTHASPTTVTLRASTDLLAGNGVMRIAAGSTTTHTLQPGEVLQLMPEPIPDAGMGPGTTDPSGSTVDADHPVAVFAGHSCAYVPSANGFCDHLEEQLPPLDTWGTEAIVTQFADRPGIASVVRITAQRNGTMVRFEPASAHAPVELAALQTLEFESADAFQVRASAPIAVTQYMSGERPRMSATSGSPAMVLQLPSEQFRTSYAVLVPATYVRNFVNLVARANIDLRIDGAPITVPAQTIGASPWVYRTLEVQPGPHRFESAVPGEPFGITVYGVAPNTSYAYPGGIDLAPINPPG